MKSDIACCKPLIKCMIYPLDLKDYKTDNDTGSPRIMEKSNKIIMTCSK